MCYRRDFSSNNAIKIKIGYVVLWLTLKPQDRIYSAILGEKKRDSRYLKW